MSPTLPVYCTWVTGPIRAIMPGAAVGSSAVSPPRVCPLATVRRLVPSWLISFSSPAWEEDESPSTETIAATPIALPGGRVVQMDCGRAGRSAGDADPPTRPAGALSRAYVQPVCQRHRGERRVSESPWLPDRHAGVEQPVGDVVERGCVLGEDDLL